MIEGGVEDNNGGDIVVYDEKNDNSGSKDNEGPTKRSRLDNDTAEMAEVATAARDLSQSYGEAVNGPESQHWIKAIEKEFEANERNKTWTPVKANQTHLPASGSGQKRLMDDTERD